MFFILWSNNRTHGYSIQLGELLWRIVVPVWIFLLTVSGYIPELSYPRTSIWWGLRQPKSMVWLEKFNSNILAGGFYLQKPTYFMPIFNFNAQLIAYKRWNWICFCKIDCSHFDRRWERPEPVKVHCFLYNPNSKVFCKLFLNLIRCMITSIIVIGLITFPLNRALLNITNDFLKYHITFL